MESAHGRPPRLFVVHGRDQQATTAITTLVEAMGIGIVTWSEALSLLDINDRSVWQVVRRGIEYAGAILVLSTPDEVAMLRPELQKNKDSSKARGPRYQPRQNVLLELGYALQGWEEKIIEIVIGVDAPSDREGKWVAGIPSLAPAEFRLRVAEMLSKVFEDQRSNISARQDHWSHAGDIEALFLREEARKAPSFVECGTEVAASRFSYAEFFAVGSEYVLTGTNFGDPMGAPGLPPGRLHSLIVRALKRSREVRVYLAIAPFELLGMVHHNAIRDLQERSSGRLQMLQNDPRLTSSERERLHIFDHPGAMFLSVAIRDADPRISDHGQIVATPRWFKDESGPSRFFFAIERKTNPELFKTVVGPIYPSIMVERGSKMGVGGQTLGGRSIDEICARLNVAQDTFTPELIDWPVG